MGVKRIKLSDLQGLTPSKIEEKLNPLIEGAFSPPNGSINYLKQRIARFEASHGMTSEEMMEGVASGKLQETEAFATWGIDYTLLKELSVNQD
jgi:hypothetical protein